MSKPNRSVINSKGKRNEFNPKLYERPGLSADEVEEIKEAFDVFDTEGLGEISANELLDAMKSLKFDEKNPSIYRMIDDFNVDGEGVITFEEFLDMMTAKISDRTSKEDLKRVFNLFDEDRQGFITVENLKKVAKDLGEDIPEEELKEIVLRADLDKDQKLGFEDFYNILTKKSFV